MLTNRTPILLLLSLSLALVACGKGNTVNGHTARTAYRSVKMLKEKLPPDNKIEFEVSFWTIRDANPKEDDFLSAVDGKSPWDIIDMGKEIYKERKATGFKGYEKYNTWEEMIAKFDKERIEQEKTHTAGSKNFDSANTNPDTPSSIIYNMRGPKR